jgi:hypothetical protein
MSLARLGAIGALLLGGCSLLPSVSGPPTFQADALVAADTWSFSDLTLRPSVQQALYIKDVLDLFTSSTEQLKRIPTASGRTVDFEKDVLPRLDGEVAFAVGGPTSTPRYTLLIHTNDTDATLRLLADEAEPKLTKDARGVTHYTSRRPTDAYGAFKNWVVYTNSSALFDQTIDRIDGKGGPSLAKEGRYRAVVDRLDGDRLGYGYLDLAPLIEQASASDVTLVEALKARGRMAYALGFEAGPAPGVRALGMRAEFMPDAPQVTAKRPSTDALQAMDRLPRGSMFALAGSDLGMQVESLAAFSKDQGFPDEVRTLLRAFAGPYAFGITAPSGGGIFGGAKGFFDNNVLGGVFFVAKLTPDADTEELQAMGTTALDAVTSSSDTGDWQYEIVVDEGWLAVNAVPAPAQLDQLPEDLLASDRIYQWVRPGFGQTGNNFYLNLDAVLTAYEQMLPSTDALDMISPIRGVGISGQTDPDGNSHAHIQVLIAPK